MSRWSIFCFDSRVKWPSLWDRHACEVLHYLFFLFYVSLTFFFAQFDREAVSCQFCRGVVSSFLSFFPFILFLCAFEILLGTMWYWSFVHSRFSIIILYIYTKLVLFLFCVDCFVHIVPVFKFFREILFAKLYTILVFANPGSCKDWNCDIYISVRTVHFVLLEY